MTKMNIINILKYKKYMIFLFKIKKHLKKYAYKFRSQLGLAQFMIGSC